MENWQGASHVGIIASILTMDQPCPSRSSWRPTFEVSVRLGADAQTLWSNGSFGREQSPASLGRPRDVCLAARAAELP